MGYEAILEAFVTLAFVSLVMERALAVVFGSRAYKSLRERLHLHGMKTWIAIAFACVICNGYSFDIFAMALGKETRFGGKLITALFIAGGSKLIIEIWGKLKKMRMEIKDTGRKNE